MHEIKPNSETSHILFYDGDCGLCTHSVRFFLRVDRHKRLRYAPLQGETAQGCLPQNLREANCLSTVVYLRSDSDEQTLYLRSEAVAWAFIDVGGVWGCLGRLLRLIPTPIRDCGYKLIAKHRLKFFPKGACTLPTQEERARLLP